MNITASLLSRAPGLLSAASEAEIKALETELRVCFPNEYRDFLRLADGGQLTPGIILYSVGVGLHPAECLRTANDSKRSESPLVFVGRFAEEEFGFRKTDMVTTTKAGPLYLYAHEEDEIRILSDTFTLFLLKSLEGNGTFIVEV